MSTLDELEQEVSRLWGPSQFDWVIGRTTHDKELWFYYCGTGWSPQHPNGFWRVGGYADTISEALQAMIEAYPGEDFAYNVSEELRQLHREGVL